MVGLAVGLVEEAEAGEAAGSVVGLVLVAEDSAADSVEVDSVADLAAAGVAKVVGVVWAEAVAVGLAVAVRCNSSSHCNRR